MISIAKKYYYLITDQNLNLDSNFNKSIKEIKTFKNDIKTQRPDVWL